MVNHDGGTTQSLGLPKIRTSIEGSGLVMKNDSGLGLGPGLFNKMQSYITSGSQRSVVN